MALFNVRRYQGADKAEGDYQKVEAETAQKAAEQVCGEQLTPDGGGNSRLRATVHTIPPKGMPIPFFKPA